MSAITKLNQAMRAHQLDAYIVPSADYHASEYVHPYFAARAYLSGFTGSAGTLVVTEGASGLFTDARYFLQAEEQLAGSEITLYRMGEPNVPDIAGFLLENIPEQGRVGVDGRNIDADFFFTLQERLQKKQITLLSADLIADIWLDRPPLPAAPAQPFPDSFAGRTVPEKLDALRCAMRQKGADVHILTTLDDIAWLFHIRGSDIPYNPLVLSYAIIELEHARLFIDEGKLSLSLRGALRAAGVQLRPYEDIYAFVTQYHKRRILLDPTRMNYTLYASLAGDNTLIQTPNPTIFMKAVKNDAELRGMRQAHLQDGIAMVKFLAFLKINLGKIPMTERSAAEMLRNFRLEQGALGESFATIAGYGAHAAIVHYSATADTDAALQPAGFLLLDSGGQYPCGTTDITRTIALGEVSAQQKRHFTLVLKGMLQLAHARFPAGCRSDQLDILARAAMWKESLDYKHGTGHGVGCYLCVHEPPIRVYYKTPAGQAAALLPGMILSNEPGLYIGGSYGIRLENLLAVRREDANEYGEFLSFETLTLCPIDLSGIEPSLLTREEKDWLNAYHRRVYEALSPHLSPALQEFLKEATRALP